MLLVASPTYTCIYNKLKEGLRLQKTYGYIITNKVVDSLEKINIKLNIKPIFTLLSEGIKKFIDKLYNNNYIHGDIRYENITYNIKNNTFYFIDFGISMKLLKEDNLINTKIFDYVGNYYYHILLRFLNIVLQYNSNKTYNFQEFFIYLRNNFKFLYENTLKTYNNNISNSINSFISFIFNDNIHNIQQNIIWNYINRQNIIIQQQQRPILELLKIYFYDQIKLVDIHSLNIFLFIIFYSNDYPNLLLHRYVNLKFYH